MRQKHRIIASDQISRNMRLIFENVESRSEDHFVLERFSESCFINHTAAADIDQHALRTKRLQHFRIDNVFC